MRLSHHTEELRQDHRVKTPDPESAIEKSQMFAFFAGRPHYVGKRQGKMQALIIIEAKGKVSTWQQVLKGIGLRAHVLATHGHLARFPERLTPLGIDLRPGSPTDPGRVPDEVRIDEILTHARALPALGPIYIATDDDPEGDVIAFDVIEALVRGAPGIADRIFRIRPRSLSRDAIVAAMDAPEPLQQTAREVVSRSIAGRARAVSDRWIGSVFSGRAQHPVGRVRSALLGAFLLLERSPDLLRGRPELGEITLRCRARSGGPAFLAQVRLDGTQDPSRIAALVDMATRFQGRMVPGMVSPRQSLSAAVAPRVGSVRPFNTGDAIAYAARHFNLGAGQAMRGLQDAYMSGMLSYPRTDSRDIGRDSAVRVVRLADACRIHGSSVAVLCDDPDAALHWDAGGMDPAASLLAGPRPNPASVAASAPTSIRRPHEALHPVCDIDRDRVSRMDAILRSPLAFRNRASASPEEVMEIMIALVGRRAIEAARHVEISVGDWRPDNGTSISAQDAALLADLDWIREEAPALPWSKDLMTGVRYWPLRAIAIDLMMSESIGRPSTYATHADTAEASGEIDPGSPGSPPRPSPHGRRVLMKIPRSLWIPEVCRMIEAALGNAGNPCGEVDGETLHDRIRRRVLFWLAHVPDDMRDPLVAALDQDQGGRETAGPRGAVVAGGPDHPVRAAVSAPGASPTPDPCALPVPSPMPT